MELSKSTKQELFIAFMDYEKAFDFLNRPKLINKMMERGIGGNYAHALYDMYTHTTYTPKLSPTELGEAIEMKHGATQGRSSSANYYSFYVSDMTDSLKSLSKQDYLDPNCLAQLADDSTIFAGGIEAFEREVN